MTQGGMCVSNDIIEGDGNRATHLAGDKLFVLSESMRTLEVHPRTALNHGPCS
jgi:hypothetical protein